MQTFTTDRRVYLTNELKSWVNKIIFILLLYFVSKLFFSIPHDRLLVGIAVVFILTLGDTLTRYRVKAIKLDADNGQLTFILYSLMSGQKTKTYDLQQAQSEQVTNSLLTNLLDSPLTLRILLPKNELFRISSRYGFPTTTLTEIDAALRQMNNQKVMR